MLYKIKAYMVCEEYIFMRKYISELIDIGMGAVIDMSIDKVIMEDELYLNHMKSAKEIQKKFDDLGFTEEQKDMVEDYIASIMAANERACNLTYLIGARNTIQFLGEINALKDDSGR